VTHPYYWGHICGRKFVSDNKFIKKVNNPHSAHFVPGSKTMYKGMYVRMYVYMYVANTMYYYVHSYLWYSDRGIVWRS